MQMRVLLVNPPRSTKVLGLEEDKLGILYIAAVIRNHGINVQVYDGQIENNSFTKLKHILKHYNPTVLGIAVSTPTRFDAFKTAKLAKKINNKVFVVAGGPHVTAASQDTLENIKDIDVAVIGEGEFTFLELCDVFSKKGDFDHIKGIAFRKEGKVVINARRERISNLDELPFPARDLLRRYKEKDEKEYYHMADMPNREMVKMPNVSVITGRGCPFNCLFCAAPELWGRSVKLRSIENVISEIKYLKSAYNIDRLRFCDDTFNINKKRVFDICTAILREGLDIKWHCHVRVDNVDKETLSLMKRAGCYIISVGVESGSQAILDNVINKRITLDKVKEVIKWCDELNIKRSCNFIYSLPGETVEDVNKTLSLMENLGGKQPFGPTIILPGSRIEEIAKAKGLLPKKFSWAKISPYKYYDPTSNSYLPIFVDKLSWKEILDIFYRHIVQQSTVRTRNYIFRIAYRIFQVRSLIDLKLVFSNYVNFVKIFIRNLSKTKLVPEPKAKLDATQNYLDMEMYRAFLRNSFWYFVSAVVASISLFAINVILARLLGRDEYAVIVLLMSVVGAFIAVSNFGIFDAATKVIAEHTDKKEIGKLISSSMGLFTILSLLASLILFLFSDGISRMVFDGGYVFYLKVASLWVFCLAFVLFIRAVGIGLHRKDFFILGDVLYNPPKLLYILVLLPFSVTTYKIVIGWTWLAVSGFLALLFYFIRSMRKKGIRLPLPSYSSSREIFKYGIYLYLPVVSVYMINYILTLELGAFSSKENVSSFAVSMSLVAVSFLLFVPISKILMPTVSRLYKLDDRNKLEVIGKVLAKYMGVASIFIASISSFGSALILRLIYGSQYLDATNALVILSMAIFFETYKFITDPFLNGTGHARTVSHIEIVKLIVIITSGSFLIRAYGAVGAASAFLIGSFISYMLKLHMLNHRLSLNLSKEAIKIFLLVAFLAISLLAGFNFVVFLTVAILFVLFSRLVSFNELKTIYGLIVS